ncbi:cysteine synthase A [Actinomyces sp. zg-332]|uniref:cysteine synthase A n=1 Tax=Actinomyces sp. zg-332 TaxID=2708340 RepID=UPI00141FE7F4|nr:cysteine synthase A [Actinomyces sp. zg-332]QPK94544.1 cysteine synthase A [Actinomyces sp. zg-332]
MIYSKVTELIGSTPLFDLGTHGENSNIYAKLEMFNPGSSVKDRPAYAIIKAAIESGELKEGGTIFEGTSGNTGIALAMVGTSLGFRVVIVMPESMTIERRNLITAFGAELVLTPASEGMRGAVEKTEELAKQTPNSIIASQFANVANPAIHYETTAKEIEKDMEELGGADIFVSAFGTGGTLTGVARYLKEKNPNITIVGIEPTASPLITEGKAGPHKIQGIGANFIPENLDTDLVDEVITVDNDEAFEKTRHIAKEFGLLVGVSSGAAYAGSIKIAERFPNKKIVTVFPDTGQRYLSVEGLFN